MTDVRDKLLFEPEYAGSIKEKVPPKASLRIPWGWLPAALCLLLEVLFESLLVFFTQTFMISRNLGSLKRKFH